MSNSSRDEPNDPPDEPGSTFRPARTPKPKKPVPSPYDDLADEDVAEILNKSTEPPKPKPRTGSRLKKPSRPPAPEKQGWKVLGETMLIGKVRAGDLAVFCRQFGVYLDSGVGILRALDSLRQQVAGTAMGPVAERIRLSIKRGASLADAVAVESQAFDPMAISMLRVAEARGGMPETLKSLASHYEARQRFWRQARSAMIYPSAVILIALAVGGFLTIFVLPTLVAILEDTVRGKAVDLPGPTKLLIGMTKFIQTAGWWLIPLLLVGGRFGTIQAYRSRKTKRYLDEVLIRLPGLGGLIQLIDQGRFARTLSDLLDAGVDIDNSLKLAADVCQFEPYRQAVLKSRAEVFEGSELAPALRATRRFAPDMLAFVETGEETGQLPENLARVAEDYEDRAEHLIKNIGSVIQPLLMIVIGGIVGFVAVSFIMAYVAVLTSLMGGH
jgi:type II secretory pathway component PulF